MAEYTFFFNPMSRAQIARWALHEAGADYEPVFVAWDAKPQALLDANPMGKLPTIIHHHEGHDHVVSEAAAVCHYLAEMSAPALLPARTRRPTTSAGCSSPPGRSRRRSPPRLRLRHRRRSEEADDRRLRQLRQGRRRARRLVRRARLRLRRRGSRWPTSTSARRSTGAAVRHDPGARQPRRLCRAVRAREAYQAGKAIDNALIAEMQAAQPA
jgi:glutathione S-transferase